AESPASTAIPQLIAESVIEVPVGSSNVLVSGSFPVLADAQKVIPISAAGAAYDVTVGMVLCNDAYGAARYTGGAVSAWLAPVGMSAWRVTFANTSGATRYVVWPEAWETGAPFGFDAGSPALWVLGYGFPNGGGSVLVDRADAGATAVWGERVHAFGESPWWQDSGVAEGFLDEFLADTTQPRAHAQELTVPADPRWQIGDAVLVTDWSGRVPGFVARITSIRLMLDRGVEHGMVGKYGLRQIVGTIPIVTAHPSSVTVSAGSTATFSVAAAGASSYQWQRESRPGAGFSDVSGATSASYTTGTLSVADSGARFRCRVVNASGDDTTSAATLTVNAVSGVAPTVDIQSGVWTYDDAEFVDFVVTITGSPAPSLLFESKAGSYAYTTLTGVLLGGSTYRVGIPFEYRGGGWTGVNTLRVTATNGLGSASDTETFIVYPS
ncbi:MAG: immunoglobulin domain-containing protein, partial [Micrococcales bacterium]|nr:immunoglobulin domain-containing protein [Micrococcales bacterium]